MSILLILLLLYGYMMSTLCSKHVEAYNKRIIKQEFVPQVMILQGYSGRNTTTLSGVYNLSPTTCFGHCCCGHHQVGYNFYQRSYIDMI